MKGTNFGQIHSYADLHLIQQSYSISPATPRTNFVEIPGADGAKDMTEVLGVGVQYEDREITWSFALYPEDDYNTKISQVSNALNGIRCSIVLDDDPTYYYDGRVIVEDYEYDRVLKRITVRAVCKPYKQRVTVTTINVTDIDTNYRQIVVTNDRMAVIPTLTLSTAMTINFDSKTISMSAGTHSNNDIRFVQGNNNISFKTVSGTGTAQIVYRQGSL